MSELDIPVSVCIGKVSYNGEQHYHYWNQIGPMIVDATADQFGISDDVIIEDKQMLSRYDEDYFRVLGSLRA